jgi:thiamine biosynthesis lipoprotein ApbE
MPQPCPIGSLALFVLFEIMGPQATAADEFVFHHENVMGTSLELAVAADTAVAAQRAEKRVLSEIDRLSSIYSSYDRQSEFSRWQQAAGQGRIKVSHDLFEILSACDHWRGWSGGAFDPRVESLSLLWARCAAMGRTPTDSELLATNSLMSQPAWKLDSMDQTAERVSNCPLSLNGIAKGQIVEQACTAALDRASGVRGLALNVGGDLCARGEISRTVGIAAPWADSESSEPLAWIAIKDRCVATSGSSQRGIRIQGRWYSHIFDPRTGRPVEHVQSATVIARRGIQADVLAKVFNVLPPEESIRLANSLEGVACLIVSRAERVVRSDAWRTYEQGGPFNSVLAVDPSGATRPSEAQKKAPQAEGSAGAPAWNHEFELVVNFEINRPQNTDGPYRRPYVAIWVEDSRGFAVRTLVLWVSFTGAGPFQWLPDLKRWYKSERVRKLAEKKEILFTVSRPTRPPGKYSAIWDGKDNDGKQLDLGEYAVCIDAAREHGTYQSIRKQVTLGGRPFTEELKGNVEIKSASIQYRRKAAPK